MEQDTSDEKRGPKTSLKKELEILFALRFEKWF